MKAHAAPSARQGNSRDSVLERRIVIGHERSSYVTTHNDLPLTIEALSGGLLSIIYAKCFESVRLASDNFSRELTNTAN
jgi:hypothetical protein